MGISWYKRFTHVRFSSAGAEVVNSPSNIYARGASHLRKGTTAVTPRVTETLIKSLKMQLSPNTRLNQVTKV
jgi:hypothetical protein